MSCIEEIICILNNILKKVSSKNNFYEKVKMTKKKRLQSLNPLSLLSDLIVITPKR